MNIFTQMELVLFLKTKFYRSGMAILTEKMLEENSMLEAKIQEEIQKLKQLLNLNSQYEL